MASFFSVLVVGAQTANNFFLGHGIFLTSVNETNMVLATESALPWRERKRITTMWSANLRYKMRLESY